MGLKRPDKAFVVPCLLFSLRLTPSRILWKIIGRKYYLVFLSLICTVIFCWAFLSTKQLIHSDIALHDESRPKQVHLSVNSLPKVAVKTIKKPENTAHQNDMDNQETIRNPYQGSSEEGSSVIINGRFRTGSSFIGSFFQFDPKVHYIFEPLQFYPLPFTDRRQDYIKKVAETRLREILNCDYTPLFKDILSLGKAGAIRVRKWWIMAMCRNKGLKYQRCERNITRAFDACLSAQHRVVKEITLSNFSSLVPLMKEGVKVIHLIRDPRGQVNSIIKMYTNISLETSMIHFRWKLTEICAELRNTFRVVHDTFTKDPLLMVNYKLIRYEDFAMAPLEKAKEIYKFTNIEPDERTLDTINC